MSNLINGETMNKVYDIIRGLTLSEIAKFQAEVLLDASIPDAYARLMIYQTRVAIKRGWHK